MKIVSKLPHVGTTIFTVMSNRARELDAINLSQGFPDYDPPDRLKELVGQHVAAGHNQYAPMIGVPELREQISLKLAACYGHRPDPDSEITIALGATEAIFSAVIGLVHAGDEVIMFDPSYDSYAPAVLLAGGRPIRIALRPPEFSIDWQRVRDAVTPRLRLVLLNSPHNPTGSIIARADLETLAEILRPTDAIVISDEVYEHMVYDGASHSSILAHAELRARGIAVFSFGKSLHATGWRVGYCIAPPELTTEIRRVHQFNTFTIATPLQHAIADFMKEQPQYANTLRAFFERKRDLFLQYLAGTRFTWKPSAGTYFQLLDYSAYSAQSDVDFCDTLIRKVGVASIPLAPFYAEPPRLTVLRFCFAKNDSTLEQAAARLRKL